MLHEEGRAETIDVKKAKRNKRQLLGGPTSDPEHVVTEAAGGFCGELNINGNASASGGCGDLHAAVGSYRTHRYCYVDSRKTQLVRCSQEYEVGGQNLL